VGTLSTHRGYSVLVVLTQGRTLGPDGAPLPFEYRRTCLRFFVRFLAVPVPAATATALFGPAAVGAATVPFRSACTASKPSDTTCSQATLRSIGYAESVNARQATEFRAGTSMDLAVGSCTLHRQMLSLWSTRSHSTCMVTADSASIFRLGPGLSAKSVSLQSTGSARTLPSHNRAPSNALRGAGARVAQRS
jgi:hypothetical protein